MVDNVEETPLTLADLDKVDPDERDMTNFIMNKLAEGAPQGTEAVHEETRTGENTETEQNVPEPTTVDEGEPVKEATPEGTPEESSRGYLREQDYSAKLWELKQEREKFQKESEEMRVKYETGLAQVQQYLAQGQDPIVKEIQSIDWAKLSKENPQEWVRKKQEYEAKLAQANYLNAQAVQAQQARYNEIIQREGKSLLTKIPEWQDDNKRNADWNEINVYLLENGLRQEEINALADHRAIKIALDAMRGARSEKARTTLATKKAPPGKSPSMRPSTGNRNGATPRNKSAIDRAMKTGKVTDIMDVIRKRL